MNKDKVYLEGYVVGHAADTLGYKGLLVQLGNSEIVEIDKNLVHEDIDKPQLIKLKDIIARIKGFDSGTRKVWLDGILGELGSEYGSLKYKQGYEQGKVEGLIERKKVTVPQFVAEFIEESKKRGFHLLGVMRLFEDPSKFDRWFYEDENIETFARAWLDGYEVEKEKRYLVKMKNIYNHSSMLKLDSITGRWFFGSEKYMCGSLEKHTRKELEQAGFEWMFDCPGIEIEEVE